MLQALGGKLISKDLAMRELPFGVNVTQEQEKIEIEEMRNGLVGALQAYSQAIPQMAASGQDPTLVIQRIADVIKARQKGKAIEDIIEDVFAPQVPPAGAEPPVEPSSPAPGEPPVGGPPQGGNVEERPDLQTLLSSLSSSGKAGGTARLSSQRAV